MIIVRRKKSAQQLSQAHHSLCKISLSNLSISIVQVKTFFQLPLASCALIKLFSFTGWFEINTIGCIRRNNTWARCNFPFCPVSLPDLESEFWFVKRETTICKIKRSTGPLSRIMFFAAGDRMCNATCYFGIQKIHFVPDKVIICHQPQLLNLEQCNFCKFFAFALIKVYCVIRAWMFEQTSFFKALQVAANDMRICVLHKIRHMRHYCDPNTRDVLSFPLPFLLRGFGYLISCENGTQLFIIYESMSSECS